MTDRAIVLATRNPGKLREIRQVLSGLPVRVAGLAEYGTVQEPAETGETFAQNARQKALYYARATGQWSLADDSGLEVEALAGAPGVRSARYAADAVAPGADRKAVDAANNAKLLAELERTGDSTRAARFVCCLALADPQGHILLETRGELQGRIARKPRGENGFGYDPVFHLPRPGRTAAQLSAEDKNAISHRGQAVREFARRLQVLLKNPGTPY